MGRGIGMSGKSVVTRLVRESLAARNGWPLGVRRRGARGVRPGAARGAVWIGVSLAAAVGVGAWVLARPRRASAPAPNRTAMPTLAGGRGVHVERTVTVM